MEITKNTYAFDFSVVGMMRAKIESRGRCEWFDWPCPDCGWSCLAYQGIDSDYMSLCQNKDCKNYDKVACLGDMVDCICDEDWVGLEVYT